MLLRTVLPVEPSLMLTHQRRVASRSTIVLLTTRLSLAPVGAVDLVEADAARVVVVEQVVADDAVDAAVHVDAGAAADAVAVDHVALDERVRDQAVAAPALASPFMWRPLRVVVVDDVVADDRPVAAVRHVDAVLGDRVVRLVVLDDEVVDEAGEDAPAAVVAELAVRARSRMRRGRPRGCRRACGRSRRSRRSRRTTRPRG